MSNYYKITTEINWDHWEFTKNGLFKYLTIKHLSLLSYSYSHTQNKINLKKNSEKGIQVLSTAKADHRFNSHFNSIKLGKVNKLLVVL